MIKAITNNRSSDLMPAEQLRDLGHLRVTASNPHNNNHNNNTHRNSTTSMHKMVLGMTTMTMVMRRTVMDMEDTRM